MKVMFMGTPDFSVPVLQQLIDDEYNVIAVVTQPDRPKGRKKVLTPPPVKRLAQQHHIPVIQPEKIRDPKAVEKVLAYEPDLIVTCAYGQILPVTILDAPKFGCINVHASLLPEYRGGAPIHKAIIDGKKETGVTIMYMVKAMDAGDILTQVKVPIEETDNVGTMHDKLSYAGAHLLSKTIPDLIAGRLTPMPQESDKVTFSPTIRREDEHIDWNQSGEMIYNKIRGLNPFPGAYTVYNDQVMKLWEAKKVTAAQTEEPGTILNLEKDGFVVATGNDVAIKIIECQPAGKKKMKAGDFVRGGTLHKGDRLV
ncbi:methionyl-tRNA formyltransferase [Pullulanibacillus pueri]|uniref:Methionyl-tRNA formyltransferase n=1 Tax=Pullulanibacillus pueri TaxID=1437324 RepID=A0A8J2ZSG3_9BACL|nr:methionyl-tRNA formyltransferase [Pullulanibacillus pueri]MBM7680181.1 methionyl-tRNA formyltransferase [Pullulanibacillus pueri]GGH74764.1 methionyl-tRNA formyltransferase [Pullulanibacillus pueri]